MDEQFFIAECDEAMYPIATDLGKLAAKMLPDTAYIHKFERLWREVGKYSDVLAHVKGRSAKDPDNWMRVADESGEVFATVFCRTLEQQVIPLLNAAAQRSGRDPNMAEGHKWIMSRFRKFGDMFFTEYNYSVALQPR